jgi:hypothetical protein
MGWKRIGHYIRGLIHDYGPTAVGILRFVFWELWRQDHGPVRWL